VSDPSADRDGSPAVAALATHVNKLGHDLKSLAAKVDVLATTQQEHTVVLNGISELRRQVEQIHAILAEEDDDSPAVWFWLTMTEQERDEKFIELSDWVETVFRAQYPDYLADQIRPCWPNHPEARWELAWLYQQWSLAYLAKRPAPRDAADWHDRWSPGALHRLSKVMSRCEPGCVRNPSLMASRSERGRLTL
jgi:hypothetical protein